MDASKHAPVWLYRPLPVNAVADDALGARLDQLAERLPDTLADLHQALDAVKMYSDYDAAANRAGGHVWQALDRFLASDAALRCALLVFASEHMGEEAQARIYRRLIKDSSQRVRARARQLIQRAALREVALPLKADANWDTTGWLHGTVSGPISRHAQGRRVQEQHGLPPLANLGQLRKLLGIRSPRQLGFLLLATDKDNGPYTRFTIPKRDGSEREICAPRKQLRWVQRQIFDKVLARISPHEAAHGFIPGRSTVTNALPHRGAAVILKFDLSDFFPTIHYYRVVGLFASLGYYAGDTKFGSADDFTQVAPTLARLCCHTADPRRWGDAVLPQGAPTSPAISNLVCRRLDARLAGLAQRNGGVYTRYADDLTFSFKERNVALGRFRWWVDQVCHQEGFFINHRKFHVIRAAQRQVVTGIVVNDELRIPREERRRFRAILHNCRRHGLESQSRGHPRFAAYLRGFASYIHMVHPEEGTDLLEQVDALLGPETDDQEGAS